MADYNIMCLVTRIFKTWVKAICPIKDFEKRFNGEGNDAVRNHQFREEWKNIKQREWNINKCIEV